MAGSSDTVKGIIENVRELGINAFVHGHENIQRSPSKIEQGLSIVNLDTAAFWHSNYKSQKRSIGVIDLEGRIKLSGDLQAFRQV